MEGKWNDISLKWVIESSYNLKFGHHLKVLNSFLDFGSFIFKNRKFISSSMNANSKMDNLINEKI